jgi:SAM-dependent methyltransferase
VSGRAPVGQRGKWESFWQDPTIVAEATHRLSVDLALALLDSERHAGRPLRVLDLGCGTGRAMAMLAAAGCRVVGVDLAAGALRVARRDLGPDGRLIQADAFRLGLASGSFDVVLSLGYASVGSYVGAQDEIARVLRPNGVALIDFRRVGLYHLPVLPWHGRRLLAAWRRGEVALPLVGLRPAPTWAAAGLRLVAAPRFNTFPPLGDRLRPRAALAFERRVGRPLSPLLARTVLAKFRKAG